MADTNQTDTNRDSGMEESDQAGGAGYNPDSDMLED
jgi:hypothetical protein